MTDIRADKVAKIADRIPEQTVYGKPEGDLLVVSWGGTYGACHTAVQRCQEAGHRVSHAHVRYLNPFPKNLGDLLGAFDRVLVPELNMGQLRMLLRSQFLVDCIGFNKVKGKPFSVSELIEAIESHVPSPVSA